MLKCILPCVFATTLLTLGLDASAQDAPDGYPDPNDPGCFTVAGLNTCVGPSDHLPPHDPQDDSVIWSPYASPHSCSGGCDCIPSWLPAERARCYSSVAGAHAPSGPSGVAETLMEIIETGVLPEPGGPSPAPAATTRGHRPATHAARVRRPTEANADAFVLWHPADDLFEAMMPCWDQNCSNQGVPRLPVNTPPLVDIRRNIRRAEEHHFDLIWFTVMVRPRGFWDYKRLSLEAFEDFGNLHYGAVGAALGVPEDILLRAAGFVHVAQNAWKAIQGRKNALQPQWGNPMLYPPYGDDPRDQQMISLGYSCYQTGFCR